MIGRAHHLVLDAPDPLGLAQFYATLLGLAVTYTSPDWVVIAGADNHSGFAFQLAPDYRAPTWPDPAVPQQWHVDVMVDDLEAAAPLVEQLGARRLGSGDHVYADPAGHPFCLIKRPDWAAPVGPPSI